MNLTMELIGPELYELSTLELENFAIIDSVYTLAPANIDQSVPNLATIHMPIRSYNTTAQPLHILHGKEI